MRALDDVAHDSEIDACVRLMRGVDAVVHYVPAALIRPGDEVVVGFMSIAKCSAPSVIQDNGQRFVIFEQGVVVSSDPSDCMWVIDPETVRKP